MLRATLVLVLLFILGGVSSVASQGQVSDDRLIVPGVRIGKWTLEMSIDALWEVEGNARLIHVFQTAWQDTLPITIYYWSDISAATHDRSKIEYLFTTGTDFRTLKGIGAGSSSTDIERAYGRPTTRTAPASFLSTLVYDQIGLAVHLTYEKANAVSVFRPGMGKDYWK